MKEKDRKTRETKTTVEGIIAASDWDENGNVTDIMILSADEEEYHIENGDLFLNLIRNTVEACGIVRQHRNGTRSIHIRKCSVLKNEFEDDLSVAGVR